MPPYYSYGFKVEALRVPVLCAKRLTRGVSPGSYVQADPGE